MVLAVNFRNTPWVAPVYYVYAQPGLYFFSSPRSIHVQALQACGQTAGAIYADSDRWQDIRGLQMKGHVSEVKPRLEKLSIARRYLAKFPFARDLISAKWDNTADVSQKVNLYVFRPTEIHCTDNQLGFGRRMQITIE